MTTALMIQRKGRRRKSSLAQPSSGSMLAPDADVTPVRTLITKSYMKCALGQESTMLCFTTSLLSEPECICSHNACKMRDIKTCRLTVPACLFNYSHPTERKITGMAIADITLLSGFEPHTEDLDLVSCNPGSIQYEFPWFTCSPILHNSYFYNQQIPNFTSLFFNS